MQATAAAMAFEAIPAIPTGAVTPAIIDELTGIVGERGLVQDPEDMRAYLSDWRGQLTGKAAIVVRPGTAEEVAAVVRLCSQHGIAIVPQGGNTGLMGGATPYPTHTGIILSVGRLNKVLEIDRSAMTMTVEAGCILQHLQDVASENDMLLPLSLGAGGSCMIGGNLSTNAGGAQVLHYGNTRGFAMGLEVVLPNGEIWNGLRALKKNNTGYDLKHLFIGAEGTLGIITKAVIKLWPKPKDVATAWIAINSPREGVDLLNRAILASDDKITSCELMHEIALDQALRHIQGTQRPLETRSTWYILMEWSSTRPAEDGGMADRLEEFLGQMLEDGVITDATVARNEAQAKNMWHIRESQAEAGRADGPSVSYDISVATSRIPDFIEQASAAAKDILEDIRPMPIGHMGDGNVHFNFKAPVGMTVQRWGQYLPALTRMVGDMLVGYRGSISAEHGIGQRKLDELARYAQSVELDAMRSIKRALDPQNIMNPGKIFRI